MSNGHCTRGSIPHPSPPPQEGEGILGQRIIFWSETMEISFLGKSVIVTGAGHGFGRAIAHAFCARGAVTFACDVNDAGLEVTATEAKPAKGGRLADRKSTRLNSSHSSISYA